MVTTGSQETDGAVRQQFFVSSDAGRTWQLAPVQLPGGGPAPARVSGRADRRRPARMDGGGRRMPSGPARTGRSWTLAATHGITPRQPGDAVNVITNTPDGFLAAG